MDWIMIIQLVMAILTVIMEMIGGGTFNRVLTPDAERPVHLAAYQWQCAQPRWESTPEVVNNQFQGTVAMDCDVQGADGGGLIEARRHLLTELPFQVSSVNAGPFMGNLNGLPSEGYDVSLDIAAEEERVALAGRSEVATDGFTHLRSVFRSTSAPERGMASYLKSVQDELEVRPSAQEGWFRVTLRYSSVISRPWFVSSETFRNQIVERQEKKMIERRERVLNDLAAHL